MVALMTLRRISDEEIEAARAVDEARKRGRSDVSRAVRRSLAMTLGAAVMIVLLLTLPVFFVSTPQEGGFAPLMRAVVDHASGWLSDDERVLGFLGILTAIMFPAAVLLGEVGDITSRLIEPLSGGGSDRSAQQLFRDVDWRRFSAYDRLAFPTFFSLVIVSAFAYLATGILVRHDRTVSALLALGIGAFATMFTVRAELDLDSSPTLGRALRRCELLSKWEVLRISPAYSKRRYFLLGALFLASVLGLSLIWIAAEGLRGAAAILAVQAPSWTLLLIVAGWREPARLFMSRSDLMVRVFLLASMWVAFALPLVVLPLGAFACEDIMSVATMIGVVFVLLLLPVPTLWNAMLRGEGRFRGVEAPVSWFQALEASRRSDVVERAEGAGATRSAVALSVLMPMIPPLVLGAAELVGATALEWGIMPIVIACNCSAWIFASILISRDRQWAPVTLRLARILCAIGAVVGSVRLTVGIEYVEALERLAVLLIIVAPTFLVAVLTSSSPRIRSLAERRRVLARIREWTRRHIESARRAQASRLDDYLESGGLSLSLLVEEEDERRRLQ